MNTHPQVKWVQWYPTPQGLVVRCTVCGAQAGARAEGEVHAFARAHQEHRSAAPGHLGAGDMVARATKALGIAPCTPCEARRRQLNALLPRVWKR